MFKNGMRAVDPGEVLREDLLKPLGMTANALAKALRVPCTAHQRHRTQASRDLRGCRDAAHTVFWR